MKRYGILAIICVLTLGCTREAGFSSSQSSFAKTEGNGEGYSGKLTQLRHFDSEQPCSQLDRLGKPLPNEEIFYQTASTGNGKAPFLVRQGCHDVQPMELKTAEVQWSNGKLYYQNKMFSGLNPPGDFDVVAGVCPIGRTPIPNAPRINLMAAAQDWTMQNWQSHFGIAANLNGSINSLPSFSIVRTDPNYLEEYRRISQRVTLAPSTEHVFSFLARSGTVSSVKFRLFRYGPTTAQDEALTVDFDLMTGLSTVVVNANLPPAQITMVPAGNGFLCTIYFTSSATSDQSVTDIGFSPKAESSIGKVGDSIFATTAQLERVGDICQ